MSDHTDDVLDGLLCETREDIDAVIRSEAKPGKGGRGR